MDKREALATVKQYKLLPDDHFDLESVYVHGSCVKDTSTENSEIDVAVVVKKNTGGYFSLNPLPWKLRRQIDDRIEPILIDMHENQSGFLKEIQRTGIKIT